MYSRSYNTPPNRVPADYSGTSIPRNQESGEQDARSAQPDAAQNSRLNSRTEPNNQTNKSNGRQNEQATPNQLLPETTPPIAENGRQSEQIIPRQTTPPDFIRPQPLKPKSPIEIDESPGILPNGDIDNIPYARIPLENVPTSGIPRRRGGPEDSEYIRSLTPRRPLYARPPENRYMASSVMARPAKPPAHPESDGGGENKPHAEHNNGSLGALGGILSKLSATSFSIEDILLAGLIILLVTEQAEDDIIFILGLLFLIGL